MHVYSSDYYCICDCRDLQHSTERSLTTSPCDRTNPTKHQEEVRCVLVSNVQSVEARHHYFSFVFSVLQWSGIWHGSVQRTTEASLQRAGISHCILDVTSGKRSAVTWCPPSQQQRFQQLATTSRSRATASPSSERHFRAVYRTPRSSTAHSTTSSLHRVRWSRATSCSRTSSTAVPRSPSSRSRSGSSRCGTSYSTRCERATSNEDAPAAC